MHAHAQFIAFPAGLGLAVEADVRADRSRRGKISVKCQLAQNILNFCEKGECGALAMILLNRLSRLGVLMSYNYLKKLACPAAVNARWFQIRPFGSSPEKGTVFLSPNN